MMRILRRIFRRKNDLSSLTYVTHVGVTLVINGKRIAGKSSRDREYVERTITHGASARP